MSVDYRHLNLLPVWCHATGVRNAVICSGSRSAPLSLSFSRFSAITCHHAIDERSAGFIALGMAQITSEPVVIIVTSGTAVVNLFSSVAEAYYSHTPLIVITADRPERLLNRYEGQSIMQENVFGKHVLKQLVAPMILNESNLVFFESKIKDALQEAVSIRKGPIHINMPFDEPFYPANTTFEYITDDWRPQNASYHPISTSKTSLPKNILYIAGRDDTNEELTDLLNVLNIPVLADITSNIYSKNNIRHFETILREPPHDLPAPELIISSGRGLVSKILKKYIDGLKNCEHIYIASGGELAEPTSTASQIVRTKPQTFLRSLFATIKPSSDYLNRWQQFSAFASKQIYALTQTQPFSELVAMKQIFDQLPNHMVIHLGNSMPVRWGQIFLKHDNKVLSNRGASGIDGSLSSAVGAALVDKRIHLLIIGDMSFFYDINALWQETLPSNLKILVINNNGGGIFRLIDGPSMQPELESLFVMPRTRSIQLSVASFGIDYLAAESVEELRTGFEQLQQLNDCIIMEIKTEHPINGQVFELYRKITL